MYPKTIKWMNQLVETKKIPGISYAFISNKKIFSGQIGYKQIVPKKILLEENTLYDMASLTKVICTTTVILKLVEAKKIALEQPVAVYLEEMADKRVTIKELLTHTSDINGFIPNRDQLTQSELKRAILGLYSGDKRGKEVNYTDTGTVLLGFLIEKLYKKTVHEVFIEEVLMPLNMRESGFSNINLEHVAPTELTDSRGLIKGEVHDPKAFVLKEHCASAGLFATLSDTLHFVQMMLDKGMYQNSPFLKEQTVQNLLRSHTELADKTWSIGWDILHFDKRPLLFHTGYTGTFMILDINQKEAFVFLSNRVHPYDNREAYLKDRDELIRVYLDERQEFR